MSMSIKNLLKYDDPGFPPPGSGMSMYYHSQCFSRELLLKYPERFVTIEKTEANGVKSMGRNDACHCGSGQKQKKCHNVDENSLIATLLFKYKKLDSEIREQQFANSVQCLCHKGCCKCCSEYFYISQIEYFAIKNYILTVMPDKLQEYVTAARAQLDQLKSFSENEYNKLFDNGLMQKREMMNDAQYITRFRECIFLKEGQCAIYPSRPYICRTYGCTLEDDPCEIIRSRVKEQSDYLKYLVPVHTGGFYVNINEFFIGSNQTHVVFRPRPIIYWMAEYNSKEDQYSNACRLALEDYLKSMAR